MKKYRESKQEKNW